MTEAEAKKTARARWWDLPRIEPTSNDARPPGLRASPNDEMLNGVRRTVTATSVTTRSVADAQTGRQALNMATTTYEAFIRGKFFAAPPAGFTRVPDVSEKLYPFQRDLVRWALRRGRAALFCDTGLGKTAMQFRLVPSRTQAIPPLQGANKAPGPRYPRAEIVAPRGSCFAWSRSGT